MKRGNEKGFTLIEVIVVAGIIAILAGILVPLIFKEIDESKITRASADIRSISSAMMVLRKDTGQWSVMDANCGRTIELVTGGGNDPVGLDDTGFSSNARNLFSDHLSSNSNGCYNNWNGPYMAIVSKDPWGNSYLLNTGNFLVPAVPPAPAPSVWLISAGPNGTIDTQANATDLCNGATPCDDIGVRIQ